MEVLQKLTLDIKGYWLMQTHETKLRNSDTYQSEELRTMRNRQIGNNWNSVKKASALIGCSGATALNCYHAWKCRQHTDCYGYACFL